MQVEKKAMVTKMDEEADERRREMGLLRNHIQKEREEMRGQLGKQPHEILFTFFLIYEKLHGL